ncbi:MAG: 16S rRNA (cytosine(1402)-N(4))-methyltransferase RsmH [Bacteroidetes bacterium]|nr:16S rRNA (cytosine(1402)-N(4))-methyltransferase RsmH [Bacteroidota bacterium]HET6245578.1 16S rRNA (cytosine(1402)-N(4))-methyltransferase RsmH [Bacteroidia bacterium]
MSYHNPVLLKECIEGLNINPDGTYVDVTFGGGGHSREILKKLRNGKLIAFDRDPDAVANIINDERFILIKQNFRYLKNFLKLYNAVPVDGILADLGVSSHQFDVAERGFSIRYDAVLDMRMDPTSGKSALDVINTYEESELKRVFKEYGELHNAARIAKLIAETRVEKQIRTVNELRNTLKCLTIKPKENSFFAQVFQAIRIEVNGEMEDLKEFLKQSVEVLKVGGRLAVISYHSLEDRPVKNFIRSGKFEGEVEKDFYGNPLTPFKSITSKPIVPSEKETKENNRARSAKLRIAEKI